jgi:amidohydrolase
MASADTLKITVHGRQTHGAAPWAGVDPIVTAAQVVLGLQTVVSRSIDITREPAVVTIGSIHGGVRGNIIPDSVEMTGTIRTFAEDMRDDIHEQVKNLSQAISRGNRAGCTVCINKYYPVTINDPALTGAMHPTLLRVAGAELQPEQQRGAKRPAGPQRPGLLLVDKITGSEDFSYFQQLVPGLFVFIGVTPADQDASKAAPNHSPRFFIDESALLLGVRTLAHLACDFLEAGPGR